MQRKPDKFLTTISSWEDISILLEHFSVFSRSRDWLFRGVTDSTKLLVPKIGRPETRAKKTGKRIAYKAQDERAVLEMFKQQARPYMQTSVPDIELLAIAQHFGLPTRLLDWTDSFFVAAWFAVERAGAKKIDAAVWVTKDIPSIDSDFKGDFNGGLLNLAEAKSYRPPHISPRITAQGSVFVICPNPTAELSLPFVKKITIPHAAHFTIKKRLNACGVNRRILFPDLAGLSDHLAWLYKHNWLAGYRDMKNNKT